MNETELEIIRARASKATPGPWMVEIESFSESYRAWNPETRRNDRPVTARWTETTITTEGGTGVVTASGKQDNSGEVNVGPEDAVFIAHARTDIPLLLAEVDRLREELRLARLDPTEEMDKAMMRIHEDNMANAKRFHLVPADRSLAEGKTE